MRNDFEAGMRAQHIAVDPSSIDTNGRSWASADHVQMTGTGSTVFGLFTAPWPQMSHANRQSGDDLHRNDAVQNHRYSSASDCNVKSGQNGLDHGFVAVRHAVLVGSNRVLNFADAADRRISPSCIACKSNPAVKNT